VTKTHPDIDCVFLNAGVQRRFQLSDRNQFDLASLQDQTLVNFTSLVALAHAFLPFLSAKSTPTNLVL
jgi:short-subunit dehydrogenase involved in D-alanine esterification of teichoic acids